MSTNKQKHQYIVLVFFIINQYFYNISMQKENKPTESNKACLNDCLKHN